MSLSHLVTLERLSHVAEITARVILILLAAWLVTRILRAWFPAITSYLRSHMGLRVGQSGSEVEKRAQTVTAILVTTIVLATWIVAIAFALKQAGLDIRPLLAGAGVVGIAIGFGAQQLVGDVIAGLLMLLENQVRVGDVAVINSTGGQVEKINLRTITLRSLDGTIHIFRNGTVSTLSNMTYEFSYYVFELSIDRNESTDRVVDALREVSAAALAEMPYSELALEPLEVLGVDAIRESGVIVKARIKTRPMHQWTVGRELNRRIKQRFDELGIKISTPQYLVELAGKSPAVGESLAPAHDAADSTR